MSILSRITGNGVVAFGLIGSALAFIKHPWGLIPVAIAATLFIPAVERAFKKLLGSFAEVPAWPRFVALGVAVLLAAIWRDWFATLFLLAAIDGNTFDALYAIFF